MDGADAVTQFLSEHAQDNGFAGTGWGTQKCYRASFGKNSIDNLRAWKRIGHLHAISRKVPMTYTMTVKNYTF